jgi:hypothetical protein
MNMKLTDFRLAPHGSICLLHPQTEAARLWIDEHIDDEAQQWGGAIVIEPRYVQPIVDGLRADDLTIELEN